MARIKIEDLPVMEDLGKEQMKGIFGGWEIVFNPLRWVDTGLYEPSSEGVFDPLAPMSTHEVFQHAFNQGSLLLDHPSCCVVSG